MAENQSQRTIFITGANRGLGLEFTRQLSAAGHRIFAGCRSADKAGELQTLVAQTGKRITLVPIDISDPQSIRQAHETIRSQTPALDWLINNAGIGADMKLTLGELTFEPALHALRVNAVGPLMVVQQFLDLIRAGRSPKVISLSSGLGSITNNNGYPYYYAASKAALNMYMRSFAADAKKMGITSVVFDPGWVKTDMGGPQAPLSPPESIAGMLKAIKNLTPEQNGAFLHYSGSEIPF